MYCNTLSVSWLGMRAARETVLQYNFVYCDWRLEGLRIVLQYNYCVVTKSCIAMG